MKHQLKFTELMNFTKEKKVKFRHLECVAPLVRHLGGESHIRDVWPERTDGYKNRVGRSVQVWCCVDAVMSLISSLAIT